MLAIASVMSAASLGWQILLQDPPALPQEPPITTLEEVVVVAQPLREVIDQFVDEVAAPPVGRGPAKWTTTVCVGIVNLEAETAQAFVDQVSSVAMLAGLEIGEPGCSPNILLMATHDGEGLARALVALKPRAFRPRYSGAARSAEALERFQATTAPVRWWHVSMPMIRDTNVAGVRLPGGSPPFVPGEGLLRTPLRNDLRRAFVIIDLKAADGLTVRQLGDYIGMVALAQIDPEADTSSYDTVLNLFKTGEPQLTLTDWDVSYLEGLYGAELNQRNVNAQNSEIADRMERDRTTSGDDETSD